MDINIKTKFKDLFDEYIVNRKAMFIPIVAVASFMFVGYAATDKKSPILNLIKLRSRMEKN